VEILKTLNSALKERTIFYRWWRK